MTPIKKQLLQVEILDRFIPYNLVPKDLLDEVRDVVDLTEGVLKTYFFIDVPGHFSNDLDLYLFKEKGLRVHD